MPKGVEMPKSALKADPYYSPKLRFMKSKLGFSSDSTPGLRKTARFANNVYGTGLETTKLNPGVYSTVRNFSINGSKLEEDF